jgi:hypothetical protein
MKASAALIYDSFVVCDHFWNLARTLSRADEVLVTPSCNSPR